MQQQCLLVIPSGVKLHCKNKLGECDYGFPQTSQTEWLNADLICWTENFVFPRNCGLLKSRFPQYSLSSFKRDDDYSRCDNNPTLPGYKGLCFSRKIHECLILCSESLEWRIFTAHLQGAICVDWNGLPQISEDMGAIRVVKSIVSPRNS